MLLFKVIGPVVRSFAAHCPQSVIFVLFVIAPVPLNGPQPAEPGPGSPFRGRAVWPEGRHDDYTCTLPFAHFGVRIVNL